jgi:hypothetical protein
MKKKRKQEYRLDLTVCVGRSLFSGDDLDVLEHVLAQQAKPWSAGLHAWQEERERRELTGGFAESMRQIAAEKGELFRQLTAKHGTGPHERRTGSVELRGGDSSLLVVVGMDEYVFAPSAGRYLWGNTITFQFCQRDCCGETTAVLSRRIAEVCCHDMNVLYAHGHLLEEWDAKNISRDGGMMAIGADVSRYLPGLYWLNYFGKPYCELIGRERLLGAPAFESNAVGDGVLMLVDELPESWKSDETHHSNVLSHIGDQYFFLRDKPDRETRAPSYGLEELPRFARFT